MAADIPLRGIQAGLRRRLFCLTGVDGKRFLVPGLLAGRRGPSSWPCS